MSEDSWATIIEAARTSACRRIRQSHAQSKRQKPGESSRSQRWVGFIIGTNVAPQAVCIDKPGGTGPSAQIEFSENDTSLVGQFEFVEWTEDAHLRHSRFTRLREDKEARDVRRESQQRATTTSD